MKNITKIVNYKIILLFIMMVLASCEDYLEVVPKDRISDSNLWASTTNADLFLNDIYAGLPDSYNWISFGLTAQDPEENYSDNSMNGVSWRYSRTLYSTSVYTPTPGDLYQTNYWPFYNYIRKCNIFMENVTASDLDAEWKKLRLAECRFLRALFYEELWCRYGGVPIIEDVLNRQTQGDAIFRARNTSDQVYTFITDELSDIAADLPVKAAQSGRIERGAALTLKAWCELWQASPLLNTSGDKTRWALAAATYKEVMDLGAYTLAPDYAKMFLEPGSVETILAKKHKGGTSLGTIHIAEWGPTYVKEQFTADGTFNPTQDLVDEYAMANGLPITDPASGYDPQNPYVNREKRFYDDILYNGSVWDNDTLKTWVGSGSKNTLDIGDQNEVTNTAYYMRKTLDEKYIHNWNYTSSADYVIFRYADVLLAYAEAQNEAVGPDASVYDAVNQVRDRVELAPLPAGLTQDQMRTAIYRERRVELSFENKRWLDLLRLKLAEVKLNGTLHAIQITKESGKFVYTEVPAPGGARAFYANKNYYLPIPQNVIDQNSQLEQNPGY